MGTQMEDAKRRMNDKKAHLREAHNLDASELEALIKQAFPRRRLVKAGKIHAIQMGLGQERGETKRLVDAFMRNPSDSTLKTQMEDAKRRMNEKKAHLRGEHNLDASELEALIKQAFP